MCSLSAWARRTMMPKGIPRPWWRRRRKVSFGQGPCHPPALIICRAAANQLKAAC